MRETEAYLLAPSDTVVGPDLGPLLTTRLLQRALYLENPFLDQVCTQGARSQMEALVPELAQAVEGLRSIAGKLRAAAEGPLSIEEYRAAYGSAAEALEGPGAVFIDALRRVRAALASGEIAPTEHSVERDLTRALGLLARAELRPE